MAPKDNRFTPWGPDPRFQPDATVAPVITGASRMLNYRLTPRSYMGSVTMTLRSELRPSQLTPRSEMRDYSLTGE